MKINTFWEPRQYFEYKLYKLKVSRKQVPNSTVEYLYFILIHPHATAKPVLI